ncbi:MAG: hypothetical protein LBM74_03645 [Oscillospiraceae bacterium]|jgi:hypothetical protein|nr:hypothetical protein [Oscillospiraceae bacterium]
MAVFAFSWIERLRAARAAKRFYREQEAAGVWMRDMAVPRALAGLKTLALGERILMEGWHAVRMMAAPLTVCEPEKFRKQGSWMMLTMGVALSCADYPPLLAFARDLSFESERLQKQYPRVETLPYDDERLVETGVHRDAGGLRAYMKGEPEAVLGHCAQVLDGHERPLTDEDRQKAREAIAQMERCGLIPLALATKLLPAPGEYETDMVFLGIIGAGDLPRPEAPGLMARCRAAGLRPVLLTAMPMGEEVARMSGAVRPEADCLTGDALDALDTAALREALPGVDAFTGLDDGQRVRVLRALRAEGGMALLDIDPEGKLTLSLSRGEGAAVKMNGGGVEAVCELVEEARENLG